MLDASDLAERALMDGGGPTSDTRSFVSGLAGVFSGLRDGHGKIGYGE